MNWRAVRRVVASLGLQPIEFWGEPGAYWSGMSLDELVEYSEGVRLEREWARTLLAWHAANVVNLGGMRKKAIKVEKILGIASTSDNVPTTAAGMRAKLASDREKADEATSIDHGSKEDREVEWGRDDDDSIDYGRGVEDTHGSDDEG